MDTSNRNPDNWDERMKRAKEKWQEQAKAVPSDE